MQLLGDMSYLFFDKKYDFDFSVKGVTSITADPHKMGMSTIPAGGLLFREDACLLPLEIDTPYLTIRKQHSLVGTRSGAAVAAAYAVMMHLGTEGYKKIVKRCMKMTGRLVEGACDLGIEPLIEPAINIVALDVPDLDEVRKKMHQERLGYFNNTKPKSHEINNNAAPKREYY